MKLHFSKNAAAALLACGWLLACSPRTPVDGRYRVRIPIADANGSYVAQTVELHSVTDIIAMTGTVASFRAKGKFKMVPSADGKGNTLEAELGHIPSAQFIQVDGVLYPRDFASLAMTATMYHFEKIRDFYEVLGANQSLSFPRLVMVDLDTTAKNNAAYLQGNDLFFIDPYEGAGIPLTVNGGVLAHEYFHSIFSHVFQDTVKKEKQDLQIAADEERELLSFAQTSHLDDWETPGRNASHGPTESASPRVSRINEFIWSSLNEGLADYFAYEYTQNPAWILPSLPAETGRDLSQPKSLSLTSLQQRFAFGACASNNCDSPLRDNHYVGARFAHLLYLTALTSYGHDRTMRQALAFISRYHRLFVEQHRQNYLSLGTLVDLFFADGDVPQDTCVKIRDVFPGDVTPRLIECRTVPDAPPYAGALP